MGRKKVILKQLVFLVILSFLVVSYATANKSSATIEAPQSASRGSEVAIKIHVSHNANNVFHYTKWAEVKADGKQLTRWDYSWRKRPDGKEFTKEVVLTLDGTTEIVAETSCNIHGGKDPARWVINVKE